MVVSEIQGTPIWKKESMFSLAPFSWKKNQQLATEKGDFSNSKVMTLQIKTIFFRLRFKAS